MYKTRAERSHHPVQPVFRWTNLKKSVVELIGEYYVVRVQDLIELLGYPKDDNSRRTLHHTLSLLTGHQYVGKRRFVDEESEYPGITHAYYLNDSGAALLDDPNKAMSSESKIIPRHEIEITKFHIRLKRWAESKRLILEWHQPKIDYKKEINPDAYFAIKYPTLPEGRNRLHYFLEMERAPIGNYRDGKPSILRKLDKYYDFNDTSDCEKEWGFKQFRLITVVRNEEKQLNLCARLGEYRKDRMFWLTTEGFFQHDIGAAIFRTPKDYATTAYTLDIAPR